MAESKKSLTTKKSAKEVTRKPSRKQAKKATKAPAKRTKASVTVAPIPDGLGWWAAAGRAVTDWSVLVTDPDDLVRLRLALNPQVPEDVADHLLKDPVWFVRWVAARRPTMDSGVRHEVLASLASHELLEVQMLVAADPLAPLQSLRDLAMSDNKIVRTLVWRNPAASEEARASAALVGVRKRRQSQGDARELEAFGVWTSVISAGTELDSGVPAAGTVDRVWSLGETGPGGGVVFFDAGAQQWWGRYLEAAPDGWAGQGLPELDPGASWCPSDADDVVLDTGSELGWGLWNTWLIIEQVGPVSAAWIAASYRGGGYADWFLPSQDELAALYRQRKRRRFRGLADGVWWSSSQDRDYPFTFFALGYGFGADFRRGLISEEKVVDARVRPVRAF